MSRPPVRRPVLLPALRRLWRDPNRLQIGTEPGRAVMLELTEPACARLLDLLDGSRTEATLVREAARSGIAAADTLAVLAALRRAGYVVDVHALRPTEPARRRLEGEAVALALRGRLGARRPAAALRRRQAAQVLVTGASQLAVPIAAVLGSAGVGHLDPDVGGVATIDDAAPAGLLPADAYRPRGVAAADAVRRVAPEADLAPLARGRVTFAVLVGDAAPATLTALAYSRRRLPHLAVTVRDGTVVVGPLVRPGQSPCLNCLDLHRRDRDPAWPVLAAQLHTSPDLATPLAATTVLAGAAFAAEEVLTHIDGGQPTTLGVTVEITGPGQDRRRRWTHHPRCGCQRRPGRLISARERPPECFN
ncbi:MAG: TOMM precursor leader peptide-binding protein [Micromonosporaceae bacterium]